MTTPSPVPSVAHMLLEIHEQPDALRAAVDAAVAPAQAIAAELARRNIDQIVIAARGTSDHAALYGQYVFQYLNAIPVTLATPSLFTVYRGSLRLDHALVIGISQSGETPEIVEVLSTARQAGAYAVGITNIDGSPLTQVADQTLLCHAGLEQSIAATKTYTTTCAILAALAAALPGGEAIQASLPRLPDLVGAALAAEETVERAVTRYVFARDCIVLGRGFQYSTAREAALKLEETCYVIATPFSTSDFRHGPAALIERGVPVIVFAPPGRTADEADELLHWLREHDADCIVVSSEARLLELATTPIPMHLPALRPASDQQASTAPAAGEAGVGNVSIDELLAPIPYIVPGQLFAHYLARAKGLDPDHPRGLSKVTRTY
ncbi:MAG TPA: SIS domain-containing protein [Ktedonobacterales bacterium]